MVANRELDNKAAIMIVIEHLGDVQPGQKCSAVFFDSEAIRREREFHANLYSQNGVHDPDTLHAMLEANVPSGPYWLVSMARSEEIKTRGVSCRVGRPNSALAEFSPTICCPLKFAHL